MLSGSHITNTPWSPHLPVPRDNLMKPTDFIYTPHRVPVPLHIISVNKLHVCVIEACENHSFTSSRAVVHWGDASVMGIWGKCVGREFGSMECIQSYVNKCQLESHWNSWRDCSSHCRSVGCVNIVSTVADWGEEMEPSLWAATRIILEECTQHQFQHDFTLNNHSCLSASMLAKHPCQGKHVVNHDLWTNLNT